MGQLELLSGKPKKVESERDGAQTEGHLAIMLRPPVRKEQRRQCDAGQQQPERQNHPRVGRYYGVFHAAQHYGGGSSCQTEMAPEFK